MCRTVWPPPPPLPEDRPAAARAAVERRPVQGAVLAQQQGSRRVRPVGVDLIAVRDAERIQGRQGRRRAARQAQRGRHSQGRHQQQEPGKTRGPFRFDRPLRSLKLYRLEISCERFHISLCRLSEYIGRAVTPAETAPEVARQKSDRILLSAKKKTKKGGAASRTPFWAIFRH